MAYPHTQHEVPLTAATGSLASVASIATYRPGYMPFILRAVALVITTQPTTTAPEVTVWRRITVGSDTGRVSLGVIRAPLASVPGNVVYRDGFNQLFLPGEELQLAVTVAGAAGAAWPIAFIEPKWEVPANIADLIDGAI